jgi:hypothetical protein
MLGPRAPFSGAASGEFPDDVGEFTVIGPDGHAPRSDKNDSAAGSLAS